MVCLRLKRHVLRERPCNLKGGGGLWFFVSFRIFLSDNTRVIIFIFIVRKARIFFPEYNIRLYDRHSEPDYFFFLHQNQNIFFSNIWESEYFFRKKKYTPQPPSFLQVKWSFPKLLHF